MWEWCLVRNPRFFQGIQTWEEIEDILIGYRQQGVIVLFLSFKIIIFTLFLCCNQLNFWAGMTGICLLVNVYWCWLCKVLSLQLLQHHDCSDSKQSLLFLHSVLALSLLPFLFLLLHCPSICNSMGCSSYISISLLLENKVHNTMFSVLQHIL